MNLRGNFEITIAGCLPLNNSNSCKGSNVLDYIQLNHLNLAEDLPNKQYIVQYYFIVEYTEISGNA